MPQYLATLSDYQSDYGYGNSENVCEVIGTMSSGNSSSNSGESTFCSKVNTILDHTLYGKVKTITNVCYKNLLQW